MRVLGPGCATGEEAHRRRGLWRGLWVSPSSLSRRIRVVPATADLDDGGAGVRPAPLPEASVATFHRTSGPAYIRASGPTVRVAASAQ